MFEIIGLDNLLFADSYFGCNASRPSQLTGASYDFAGQTAPF
jgi:hypothetical protein